MNEGIILLIVFLIMFMLMIGIFAGLYWWYYKRKHTTNGGGRNGKHPVNCNCPLSDRTNYAKHIPNWKEKIESACPPGKAPSSICLQTQKLVCEEGGGCFDPVPKGPWCYSC